MKKLNCWEYKKCGREPGGKMVPEFGICPVTVEDRTDGVNDGKHAGRSCWVIGGTFCGGKIQGTCASKLNSCKNCDFYQLVLIEEELKVTTTEEILDKISKQTFAVGMSMVIQSGRNREVWTHLIGWVTNKFIVTQLPFMGGAYLEYSRNEKCTIKFINGDKAYGFETEVIHTQHNPVSLIFFKYPSVVKSLPFRKYRRLPVNIPAKLGCDDKKSVDVIIDNISEGGCLLKVPSEPDIVFEANKRYALGFSILNSALNDIGIKVRNVHSHDSMKILGTEFIDLPPESKQIISSFIDIFKLN